MHITKGIYIKKAIEHSKERTPFTYVQKVPDVTLINVSYFHIEKMAKSGSLKTNLHTCFSSEGKKTAVHMLIKTFFCYVRFFYIRRKRVPACNGKLHGNVSVNKSRC